MESRTSGRTGGKHPAQREGHFEKANKAGKIKNNNRDFKQREREPQRERQNRKETGERTPLWRGFIYIKQL